MKLVNFISLRIHSTKNHSLVFSPEFVSGENQTENPFPQQKNGFYKSGSFFVVGIRLNSEYIWLILCNIWIKLQLLQYLEMRFNRIVRRLTSLLYVVKQVLFFHFFLNRFTNYVLWFSSLQLFYMSIVVYAPSLALKQGINHLSEIWMMDKAITVIFCCSYNY